MAELIFFFYTSIAEFGLQKIYGELPSDSLRKQSASFFEGAYNFEWEDVIPT